MVTRSYLDALTSGMMAKLDPLSRIAREQRAARWISITRNGSEATPLRNVLWPVERYKRREELRTRIADR